MVGLFHNLTRSCSPATSWPQLSGVQANSLWNNSHPQQALLINSPVPFEANRVKHFLSSDWHREHQIEYHIRFREPVSLNQIGASLRDLQLGLERREVLSTNRSGG
jgi:hypothetical protein